MELGLKGKTAVITGGASGLGRETAKYLVADGASVVIADRSGDNIKRVLMELRNMGGDAEGIEIDVRDFEACQRMAAFAIERFGGIDILVAGAGVGDGGGPFLESSPDKWTNMLDINIRGVLNCNLACAPAMVDRKRGSIVNIASEAGKLGDRNIAIYSATKGAVIAFSKAFSTEVGKNGVRVNAICPGVTMTAMTKAFQDSRERYEKASKQYPMRRLGEPEDIASMITFLASDQATWITGQAISVNGGWGRS